MTERPVLFSGWEVRAILAGTKTQTRRIVKPQPDADGLVRLAGQSLWNDTAAREYRCPFGVPGDQLWVQESWFSRYDGPYRLDVERAGASPVVTYAADGTEERRQQPYGAPHYGDAMRSHRSVHMPRWASRITLEVLDVRVQRVQDISFDSILAEGVLEWVRSVGRENLQKIRPDDPFREGQSPDWRDVPEVAYDLERETRYCFSCLWDSIHGSGAWERNDWVFAATFRRVQP